MRIQYQGLTAELVRHTGVWALDTFGLTIISAPSGNVSVDGQPLKRMLPRLLPGSRTFLIECADGAPVVIMRAPPILSVNFKGVQVEP